MTLSKVDLPQPDGPTKTTNSPSVTSRLMPFSTSTGPKAFFTFSIFSEPTILFLALEFDGCAAAHALVGGKADGERLDRVVHVASEIQVLADRLQHEGLFEVAEVLVARFACHGQHLVRLDELAIRAGRRTVEADG